LPIPDSSPEKSPDIEIKCDVGRAFWCALGWVVFIAAGLYGLVISQTQLGVVIAVCLLGTGVVGVLFGIKNLLNTEARTLVLTLDGILSGTGTSRRCLPWERIVGVSLVVRNGKGNRPDVETLSIDVADNGELASTTHIDVHGLDRGCHEIARLVMQRVLRCNPHAKVQVKEETSEGEWKDLLVGPFDS
jgi:hypothetical protein